MTELLDGIGLVDVFRTLNPHPEQYRGGATAAGPGRRTWAGGSDYHLATPAIAAEGAAANTSTSSSASPTTRRW